MATNCYSKLVVVGRGEAKVVMRGWVDRDIESV